MTLVEEVLRHEGPRVSTESGGESVRARDLSESLRVEVCTLR
jgi:hypothetical protein